MGFELVDYMVVVLPTVIAVVSVWVAIKLEKGESHKFWWVSIVVAGVAASVLTGVSQSHARKEHERELDDQRQAVMSLRSVIQTNEVRSAADMGYLKAKLEDSEKLNEKLSKFAPAVMKLAETSAEFTRKQYETKVTSDKELYAFTIDVVKKIREFSQKYETLSRQQTDEMMNSVRQPNLTEAEKQQRWNQDTQKSIQLYYNRDNEFRTSILPDALYARQELLKRKLPEPTVSPMQKSEVDMVARGMLAGPYPELALADYLEIMAKPLSLK